MTPRKAVEAVDRYSRDLMQEPDLPMGGKVVLFGGDFTQLLPVILGAHKNTIITESFKSIKFYRKIVQHKLTINMRVEQANNFNSVKNRKYATG